MLMPALRATWSTVSPGVNLSLFSLMVTFMATFQATAATACLGQASAQAPQPTQRSTMM